MRRKRDTEFDKAQLKISKLICRVFKTNRVKKLVYNWCIFCQS